MAKQGILHDYDLMANAEESAKKETVCAVCGSSPVTYQWSDYSGEAMCVRCGCAYQLKWGGKEMEAEGAYPYLRIKPEWIPILKEYWEATKAFVCHGIMLGPKPGMREFGEWVEKNHPELMENA